MAKLVALPDPNYPDIVTLGDGTRMNRGRAVAQGYQIHGDIPVAESSGNAQTLKAHNAWRAAIMCLPEARERASAVAELLTSQTEATMSVVAARAFLRGLPTEEKEQTKLTAEPTDPRAARLAEIRGAVTSLNHDRGHATSRARAAAPSANAVDPVKLKRLAEIRLAAIENGHAGSMTEGRNLRYALRAHAETGQPLANLFNQLGINTIAMLANL